MLTNDPSLLVQASIHILPDSDINFPFLGTRLGPSEHCGADRSQLECPACPSHDLEQTLHGEVNLLLLHLGCSFRATPGVK